MNGFAHARPADRATRELAERNARSAYQGDPGGEPHVAHQLQALAAYLVHMFRTDEGLHTARTAAVDAERALADATNELPRVTARTQGSLQEGAGISPSTSEPDEAARWMAAAKAETERRRAEEAVATARRANLSVDRELATAEARSIDRLAEAAAAGIVPINGYLAAFDQARARMGRPGLGLLEEDLVHALVRSAVRPIELRANDPA